jgi:mannosylglucosylglycerate synthase
MVVKREFKKKEIPRLNYGIIHSQSGFSDGVSIVMGQIEEVLLNNLKIPKKNINYLVGNSSGNSSNVTEKKILWDQNKVNREMVVSYERGLGGAKSERVEKAIAEAKETIEQWIKKNKIDVLIVHNSSIPINFLYSIALSRYYRDSIRKRKKTPKYVLWWHDSHLERKFYLNPSRDIRNYLLEGVPGRFVEYIVFINKLQFSNAQKYFEKINQRYPGFYDHISLNSDVAYNTSERFIKSFGDLDKDDGKPKQLIEDFNIKTLLKNSKLKLKDTLFCLQHTRMINRKRIDFALKYCYELLSCSQNKRYKAVYFLVSGQSNGDSSRRKLENYSKKLAKQYPDKKVFLVFAEDYCSKTNLLFEEYPKIFAQLGGFSTYFSDVEGFGNNLLEVLASGLIPVIYKYPVFKTDIEHYGFKLLALDEYKIDEENLVETLKIIRSKNIKKKMVETNLKILKKHFPHKVMAVKLIKAITKERLHI